jgi:hypothetical protein
VTVTTEVQEYRLSVRTEPEWHTLEGWMWDVAVKRRAGGGWSIHFGARVLNDAGELVYESVDAYWDSGNHFRRCRFELDEALARGREVAQVATINGLTVTEAYEQWRTT